MGTKIQDMTGLNRINGVFSKEVQSEFKTKSSIAAVMLFILTTITIVGFGIGNEPINSQLAAAILWIIMFFSAMTGLSRIFISEEERGTALLLQTTAPSYSVYFGKLFYNTVLSISINLFTVLLYFFFMGQIRLESPAVFAITIFLSSLGLAAATTIISALISKAGTKGALFPVLAFPVLLPLIMIGLSLTVGSFEGIDFEVAIKDFNMLIAYTGIIVTLSYFLFEFVWKE